MQITERSCEAAHSLIKRRVPPHAAGPLISLALRLQDFNLSAKLNADCLWQVAEHFEVARNIRAIPMNTGVGLHPDVVQAMHAKSEWPLIRTLNKVLYRTDTLWQFPEMEHLDHNSKKKQEKQQRDAARLLALPQSEAVTYDVLRAKALHAHFLAVADANPDMMFCAPATLLEGPLKDMQSALTMVAVQPTEPLESDLVQSGPPPQLAALQALPMMAQDPQPQRETGVMPAEQQPALADDLRFFKVVHSSPSRRKTLALPAGASGIAGRLRQGDVAISLHSVTVADDGGVWASLTPQNDQVGFGSALHVLQNLPNVVTFADILSSLRCSSPQPPADGQSRYSLPCPSHLQQSVSELVTAFLGASAYPSQHGWLALPDSSALRYLQSQGFVLQGAASYQLSQDGLNSLVMYVHDVPTSFVISDRAGGSHIAPTHPGAGGSGLDVGSVA